MDGIHAIYKVIANMPKIDIINIQVEIKKSCTSIGGSNPFTYMYNYVDLH